MAFRKLEDGINGRKNLAALDLYFNRIRYLFRKQLICLDTEKVLKLNAGFLGPQERLRGTNRQVKRT